MLEIPDHEFGTASPIKSVRIHDEGVTFIAKPEFFDLDLKGRPHAGIPSKVEGLRTVEGGLMEGTVPKGKVTDALHEVWESAIEMAPEQAGRPDFIRRVAMAAKKEIGTEAVPIMSRIM